MTASRAHVLQLIPLAPMQVHGAGLSETAAASQSFERRAADHQNLSAELGTQRPTRPGFRHKTGVYQNIRLIAKIYGPRDALMQPWANHLD